MSNSVPMNAKLDECSSLECLNCGSTNLHPSREVVTADGVFISFWCEGCSANHISIEDYRSVTVELEQYLRIYFHKGETFIEWFDKNTDICRNVFD